MAPGGAHPRCALGWRRLGASSASAPRREPEQRCWVDVPPWDNLDLAVGLSGTIRSRLRGRPAREGRLLSRRTPANRLGPETGPLAGVPACTRAGSPTLGASRRRPVHIRARVSCPGGQKAFLAGPLRGHGFAWSGLVCCASRGGARGQPVVPLRPSLRASRARSGGVFRRAPAWQSPSLLEGGGSPSRPVAAAPLSSVRHTPLRGGPALSGASRRRRTDLAPAIGRAGPVRRLRTNPPPGESSSVKVLLWYRGHEGLVTDHEGRRVGSGRIRSPTTGLRQGTLRGASQCPRLVRRSEPGSPK